MRAALLQMTSSDTPSENCETILEAIHQADGVDLILTPEVSNCVSASRARQTEVLALEEDDLTLEAVQNATAQRQVWVLLGSLALKTGDPDGRFVNRSFLIDPKGQIKARYDKIHMFDVTLDETESYHESKGYRPGEEAVLAETPWGGLGMTICYDLRFPALFRSLAQAGASILTVPSAFSPTTGRAHWEPLLRARAIETGCFVLAPAQTGDHTATAGKPRKTYGHSFVVSPWGEVLLDAGTETGVFTVDLDLAQVAKARQRVPSLQHDRLFRL